VKRKKGGGNMGWNCEKKALQKGLYINEGGLTGEQSWLEGRGIGLLELGNDGTKTFFPNLRVWVGRPSFVKG